MAPDRAGSWDPPLWRVTACSSVNWRARHDSNVWPLPSEGGGHAANRETTLSTNRKKPVSRVSNLNLQRMSRDVLPSSSVCLTVQSNVELQGALHLTEIGAAGYD